MATFRGRRWLPRGTGKQALSFLFSLLTTLSLGWCVEGGHLNGRHTRKEEGVLPRGMLWTFKFV
jgi:hypothetical protein